MAKIDAFFDLMDQEGASDLHLASGSQPILRVRGEMERVKFTPLENDELKTMLYEIAPEFKVKVFEETGDVDFGYEIPGKARYRANFFNQKNGVSAVFPANLAQVPRPPRHSPPPPSPMHSRLHPPAPPSTAPH